MQAAVFTKLRDDSGVVPLGADTLEAEYIWVIYQVEDRGLPQDDRTASKAPDLGLDLERHRCRGAQLVVAVKYAAVSIGKTARAEQVVLLEAPGWDFERMQ